MGTKSILNKEPVDVIIPTYDNLDQLIACVSSMWKTHTNYPLRFIIINNGKIPLESYFPSNHPCFLILNQKENLGWTGGLEEGLKHSTSKYVVFANDDIFIPNSSHRWVSQMVRHLTLRCNIAAVGPSSNVVMGMQNIFANANAMCFTVSYLIGFCMMVNRSLLDEVGGIDPSFNTGDDIDLSMRFTKAGYYMMVDASIFVYHHGFQTGEKIYGGPQINGGWNSRKMTDDTNIHLIQKHGFLEWWYMRTGRYPEDYIKRDFTLNTEEDIVKKYINGSDHSRIADIGCGGSKIIPDSIGIDIIPNGEPVINTGKDSQADIIADAEKPFPFDDGYFKLIIARHILEHCTDMIGTLENWGKVLSDDGKMIICVPDERVADTIILNPEHVHAFTPDSLSKVVRKTGYKIDAIEEFYSADSFTMVLSKEVN